MGRLTPRAKQGLTRLAWVSGGLAVASIVFARFGGPWVIAVFCIAMSWVWEGFQTNPPRRRRAEALRTRRLVMRRILPVDLERLHQIMSDPETMRYWDAPAHADHAATSAWVQRIILPEEPLLCDDFVILCGGRVIGVLGSLRLPWVSFVFDRSEWRNGYASEALAAYIAYMFERGLPYLLAATAANNAAARALLSKTGFRETGRSNGLWRVQGELAEAVHYRLNRDGAEPDAEEERATIAKMEAIAAHAAQGDQPIASPARTA